MTNKIPLIYVIDDETDLTFLIKDMLQNYFSDVEVICYNNKKSVLEDKNLYKADLFIIDLLLIDKCDGLKLSQELYQRDIKVPRLFMSGRYSEEQFTNFINIVKNDYIFDFIAKPFKTKKILNRIHVLISASKNQQNVIKEKELTEHTIWDMLNYSALFVIGLDEDIKIKIISKVLVEELGFKSSKELIGRSWYDFIDIGSKSLCKKVRADILTGSKKYQEFSSSIISAKLKNSLRVKWFNSVITNSHKYMISIGIPFRPVEVDESIDSIRAYFGDILKTDQTMIKAVRQEMIEKTK
jgi:FixJ family two-component response regulator